MTEEGERRKCPVANCTRPELAAEHAVRKMFGILGVDVDKPESIEAFRDDLRFNKKVHNLSKRGAITILCTAISLSMASLWYALTKG